MNTKPALNKLVENEAIFRRRNESVQDDIAELNGSAFLANDEQPISDDMKLHFYCECSDENCDTRIAISINTYEQIHKDRNQFIVIPAHEVTSIEKVVERKPKYLIVKKRVSAPENPMNLHKTNIDNV